MCVWEWLSPGGNPRAGILGLTTTRGDRLFISLLGSGFIGLAWVAFAAAQLWWALPACLAFALFVFLFC